MKKILILVLVLVIVSCEKGIHKKYASISKEKDFEEMTNQITPEQLILLKNYISEKEAKKEVLEGVFYGSLLERAEEKIQERKDSIAIETEKKEEEEREKQKKKEKKKQFEAIAKLLCNKKWRIKEYAFQVQVRRKTPENIEMAKTILNRAMFIKDSELIFSVIDDKNKTYVRGKLDERVTKLFNGRNKRWKKYNIDGTYVDGVGKEMEKGTWTVIDGNTIREERPSTSSFRRKKKEIVLLDIKTLNKNTFHFFEGEQGYFKPEIDTNASILMKTD